MVGYDIHVSVGAVDVEAADAAVVDAAAAAVDGEKTRWCGVICTAPLTLCCSTLPSSPRPQLSMTTLSTFAMRIASMSRSCVL